MNIEEYWQKNMGLLKADGQNRSITIIIRKIIICQLLDIPFTEIQYYLSKNAYLRKFALGDTNGLSEETCSDEEILCRAGKELQCIYDDDYYELTNILRKNHIYYDGLIVRPKTVVKKNDIELIISFLLDSMKKGELPEDNREMLETYKKIYGISISLLNPYILEKYNNHIESYYEHLIYQWQTANELAEHVSQQRSGVNNFYMSFMSILIAGILFSDKMMTTLSMLPKILIYIIVSFVGIVICQIWKKQINNYATLNSIKYQIINEMERSLPANVLYYEYKLSEKKPKENSRKINFSQHEKIIVLIFEAVIIIIPIILLLNLLGWLKGIETVITAVLMK